MRLISPVLRHPRWLIGPLLGLVGGLQVACTDVSPATPIDPPLSPEVAPWREENFSGYASTAELLANPRGIFRDFTDEGLQYVTLELRDGFGASDRSMKYTYPDQTTNLATRCAPPPMISRSIRLPNQLKEIWVEMYVKFSANFSTTVPTTWRCGTTPDFALVQLSNYPIAGRWEIKNGTFGSVWSPNHSGGPADVFISPNTANGGLWYDGKWHRIRWHVRASVTAASGDGAFDWWLDDARQAYPLNISANAGGANITALGDLILGAGTAMGPAQEQTLQWGRIRFYRENPGW